MWMEVEPLSELSHAGRFPLLAPDALMDAQRAVYDAAAGPPRANGPFVVVDDDGHLAGPFNALLYSPDIGQAVQALGAALRSGGTLSGRTRELVICAVAAELDSDYEWYAHSRVALSVGVCPAELAVLVDYYQTLAGLLATADVLAPLHPNPHITTSKGEHP